MTRSDQMQAIGAQMQAAMADGELVTGWIAVADIATAGGGRRLAIIGPDIPHWHALGLVQSAVTIISDQVVRMDDVPDEDDEP